MARIYKTLVAACILALAGCQAMVYGTSADFENLRVGMTRAQVIQTLGAPVSVGADGDKHEEHLVYKRMKHAISAWPRTYQVTLRDGVVVRYGEQYDERNVNNF